MELKHALETAMREAGIGEDKQLAVRICDILGPETNLNTVQTKLSKLKGAAEEGLKYFSKEPQQTALCKALGKHDAWFAEARTQARRTTLIVDPNVQSEGLEAFKARAKEQRAPVVFEELTSQAEREGWKIALRHRAMGRPEVIVVLKHNVTREAADIPSEIMVDHLDKFSRGYNLRIRQQLVPIPPLKPALLFEDDARDKALVPLSEQEGRPPGCTRYDDDAEAAGREPSYPLALASLHVFKAYHQRAPVILVDGKAVPPAGGVSAGISWCHNGVVWCSDAVEEAWKSWVSGHHELKVLTGEHLQSWLLAYNRNDPALDAQFLSVTGDPAHARQLKDALLASVDRALPPGGAPLEMCSAPTVEDDTAFRAAVEEWLAVPLPRQRNASGSLDANPLRLIRWLTLMKTRPLLSLTHSAVNELSGEVNLGAGRILVWHVRTYPGTARAFRDLSGGTQEGSALVADFGDKLVRLYLSYDEALEGTVFSPVSRRRRERAAATNHNDGYDED